jgi:hypothetical protein
VLGLVKADVGVAAKADVLKRWEKPDLVDVGADVGVDVSDLLSADLCVDLI